MPRADAVEQGRRQPLNVRTTLDLRAKLDAAAVASGRSLAQEVEARLEKSFADENTADRFADAISVLFSNRREFGFFTWLSRLLQHVKDDLGQHWTDEGAKLSEYDIPIGELMQKFLETEPDRRARAQSLAEAVMGYKPSGIYGLGQAIIEGRLKPGENDKPS